MSSTGRKAPTRLRQQVKEYEDGAVLYATFGGHMKAGFASLIPFFVVFFSAQPIGEALAAIGMGGYTVAPSLLAIYCAAWAGMSYGLLHLLRRDTRVWLHYLTWALAGAVALVLASMLFLTLVTWASEGFGTSPTEHKSWGLFLAATPGLGALGSLIGRFVLRHFISWHVEIERPPLPDALEFVPGKVDKNEFRKL